MMLVACLMMALTATAQGVKISPKMEKGMKKVYQIETTINAAGKEVKVTAKQTFEVVDCLADGYLLTSMTEDFKSNADDADLTSQLMTMSMQLMNGVGPTLKADADGKVTGITNFAEIKQKALESLDVTLNRIFEKHPEAAQMVPREMLVNQVSGQLTEASVVNSMLEASSVLALNGKTVANGAQESFTNQQGLKMQRMYFLTKKDGSAVTTSAKMNMTKDELKEMIIAQVTATMPDQVEMIKQNIDMMMGQMTFDATEKANYELGADGWVRMLTLEDSTDAMGQKNSSTTTIRLVE